MFSFNDTKQLDRLHIADEDDDAYAALWMNDRNHDEMSWKVHSW